MRTPGKNVCGIVEGVEQRGVLPVRNYADEETTLDVETWGINSKDLVSVGVAYQDVTWADCNLLVGLEGPFVVSLWVSGADGQDGDNWLHSLCPHSSTPQYFSL